MIIKFEFSNETDSQFNNGMKVVLGALTIKAFVFAPKHFHAIGIVQSGMEFGVLAVSDNGDYYRVNGSMIRLLNNSDVEDAIYRSKCVGRGKSFASSRASEMACEKVSVAPVSIKKHRRIDPELAAGSALHKHASRSTLHRLAA